LTIFSFSHSTEEFVVKKAAPVKVQGAKQSTRSNSRREKTAAVIAELEQIQAPSAQVAAAIALFKSWLTDESGYDEKVWPRLKKALEQERSRVGARRLFDA
jgi:hypothetical protein